MRQTYQSSFHARRACDWLVLEQKNDGGWGEHYSSCEVEEYALHEKTQVGNTAWAVLALMAARYPDKTAIIKGFEVVSSVMEAGCRKMSKMFSAGRGKSCPFPVPLKSMTSECHRYAAFTDNVVIAKA